ncbi:OsmC family protein [Piscicoccus intestinalis]|uniref:OsmC family protein n=1 Tax=Piscicoccus intestinalis TaxID=746033 RepID=UPI0008390904|nr:OsmC family protein [Piscicoccus intestinalis]
MATRNGSAIWRGDLKSGTGEVTVGNGVYTGNYSFTSRFEDGEGTNPEELIAAAHAGCYSMQLSAMLAEAGNTPTSVDTSAVCSLRNIDGKPTITQIVLTTVGEVPGLTEEQFQETAAQAKEVCLVTRALAGVEDIELRASLKS